MIVDASDDIHSKELKYKLLEKERAVEERVIADIRRRQDKIPGLKRDGFGYLAIWGDGELTPGCKECCLKNRWSQIRSTTHCNLSCKFCYYFDEKKGPSDETIPGDLYLIGGGTRHFTEDDVKSIIKIQGDRRLSGIAWLYHEPLLKIDKMIPLMKFIHEQGLHQWLYTNGVLASEENLRKLSRAGLEEIRFNLAATNCSDGVIKNMKAARRHFKYLCIESPMYTEFYNSFMEKRGAILDTGVDHIHLAELQLLNKTLLNFKGEGPIYRLRGGYVSPIKSRQLVYDIFECAAKERWRNVVLHDCSNEVKLYRGMVTGSDAYFGHVAYPSDIDEKLFYAHLEMC